MTPFAACMIVYGVYHNLNKVESSSRKKGDNVKCEQLKLIEENY